MGPSKYFESKALPNVSAAESAASIVPISLSSSTVSPGARVLNGIAYSPTSIALSSQSEQSNFLDDIKHEAMVTYLYQIQCSHLWVGDGGGELEGVLLRKSRNNYLACPPELIDSALATACMEMNVE